jgi:hypothetical protein
LTAEILLRWPNIEQRRVGIEHIGWNKFISALNTRVIDSDNDPQIGDLLEADIPDIGKERFLKVVCGTGRTFCIPVDPKCRTALEAQSWSFGYDSADCKHWIKPEIRT